MIAVLGIDAAWTAHEPSGVALVMKGDAERWRCVCVAPNYQTFIERADGVPVSWNAPKVSGDPPDVPRLLTAARRFLSGNCVTVVAVDMPVSRDPITGRRAADNAVSRAFGAAGCSTHTPSIHRPGALGHTLTTTFQDAGYSVATTDNRSGTVNRLLEVYPHPALLRLLNEDYRIAYKAGKAAKYWPAASPRDRIRNLLETYQRILTKIANEIADIHLPLPDTADVSGMSALKRYEDAIDALVCAWVGCRYMAGKAYPLGDTTAAIWVPDGVPSIAPSAVLSA